MKTHILGCPSIGRQRQLKQALESFWNGSRSAKSLIEVAANLKKRHWRIQRYAGLAYRWRISPQLVASGFFCRA
ncbi:hypothetical protein KUD97_07465 [Desulfovibrio desulfuricans]|nr:hypothetical protein KUD97_07465 [Desulfovibrio desulfuricans]